MDLALYNTMDTGALPPLVGPSAEPGAPASTVCLEILRLDELALVQARTGMGIRDSSCILQALLQSPCCVEVAASFLFSSGSSWAEALI